MEDTLSPNRCEPVGRFTMTVASAEPTPEAEERWAQRVEALAGWLVAEWRREQAEVQEMVPDAKRPSDEDGHIRKCDLN